MSEDRNFFSKNIKFFIFGYFGWYNAGDDAIGVAILRELFKKYPQSEFRVTINEPYFLSENNFDKNIQPIDFNIFSILKAIKDSDEFIIAGGTHFQDQDEFLIRKIKVFLFFSLIVACASIIKKSPLLLGHGIGPISTSWIKFLVKRILNNSRYIIVRDQGSYNFVKSLGFENKSCRGFDVSAILVDNFNSVYNSDDKDKTLGVSLLPFYSIYSREGFKDDQVVNIFGKCINGILKRNSDIKFKLFAFRSGKHHSDEPIIMKLVSQLKEYSNRVTLVVYRGDLSHFLSEIRSCCAFIGMRYHSSLFAYLFNKPLIMIDYQEKCKGLAKDILISEDAILPLNTIDSSTLCEKMNDLLLNPFKYTAKMPVRDAVNRVKEMLMHV